MLLEYQFLQVSHDFRLSVHAILSTWSVAVILFIFAVTTGSTIGWRSVTTLAPLIFSIATTVAFFYWEACQPIECAAVYVCSIVQGFSDLN